MPKKGNQLSFATAAFDRSLPKADADVVSRLKTPFQIQLFLDSLAYGSETIYRAPLRVLRDRTSQCFDGAVLAAALLARLGHPPLILNLIPNRRDDDHVLALFRRGRFWGALAKSNFAGLRFREPVYRDVRELVMSYFEHYYNLHGEKTLRGYTRPLNLETFERRGWMTEDVTMDHIAARLDEIGRFSILTPELIRTLSPVDERSCAAGLYGANLAGLSTHPKKKR